MKHVLVFLKLIGKSQKDVQNPFILNLLILRSNHYIVVIR